jgi:NAD(P)-dependent dehydrogenase (short-subunit alcohol dehydrogenase family)
MDLELNGKVVLITGGSLGIGYSCAERFAAEGARVAIVSRKQANLDAAVKSLAQKGYRVIAVAADLVHSGEATRAVAEAERQLGPVDVLVNSAGAAKRYAPDDLTMEAWHEAMDAKYFTYVHAMQAVLPGMAARGRGNVVNIIGQGGKIARPTHMPGGAANAALMLVSAGMANAYGGKGIRVNAINPGSTETQRVKGGQAAEAKRLGISETEVRAAAEQAIPLGRYGRPEEVADVTVFLASARASYVTAACIAMDGGATPTVV